MKTATLVFDTDLWFLEDNHGQTVKTFNSTKEAYSWAFKNDYLILKEEVAA